MNNMTRNTLKMLLVVVLAVYPNLAATSSATAAPASGAPGIFAKTGELGGTVLNNSLDPVPGTSVKVLDAEGNVIAETVSDASGKFSLPQVQAGQYQLQIGEDVQLSLNVSDLGTTTSVRIVLPADAAVGAAGAAAAAEGTSLLTIGTIGLAVIGGGIAIGYAVNDDDDGHD